MQKPGSRAPAPGKPNKICHTTQPPPVGPPHSAATAIQNSANRKLLQLEKNFNTLAEKTMGENKGFFESVLPALPFVGNLFSTIMQRSWAKKDQARANEYNSPEAQIRRLKEAGLSSGYMYGTQGGGQSAPIESTNVDPQLGTSKALDAYFTNQLQKKQLALLDAEIMGKRADSQLKEAEAGWWLTNYNKDSEHIETNRLGQSLGAKLTMDKANAVGTEITNKIKQLDLDISSETGMKTAKAELNKIVNQSSLLSQELQNLEKRNAFINQIVTQFQSNGLDRWEAVIAQLIYKLLR